MVFSISWRLLNSAGTLTGTSFFNAFTLPSGTSILFAMSAPTTCWRDIPRFSIFTLSTFTLTCISLIPPQASTPPTPSILESLGDIFSSMIFFTSAPGLIFLTEAIIMGIIDAENLSILGFSASRGRAKAARSIASLTSFTASVRSVPYSKVRVTTETFSIDVEFISFRF